MILRKPRPLMKPTRNEIEYAADLSVHNMSLQNDQYPLTRHIRIGNVSAFPCQEDRNRMQRWDLRHKQHTNFCRQHDSWDSWDSFLPGGPLLQRVLHLHRFTWRFDGLEVITNWGQIRVQSFRWTHERTALPDSFPNY